MISLETSIKHMIWSDQKFYDQIRLLPDESLKFTAAPGEWSVGRLLVHLVGSAEWFRFCLKKTKWTDLVTPLTMDDVRNLQSYMGQLGQIFEEEVQMEDELLEIQTDEETFSVRRSMILAQAVMHTAEHKGQIATILKSNGLKINLDVLDLWHFTR